MATYTCSECGREAVVMANGDIIRNCVHTNAVVYLNLTATATGEIKSGNK